mmetsp:Transcript_36683/g.47388  ORF Transcript_36683/g.47388 Transcript_36683/m.47388 type:complete len:148 (-) Transcript_36683:208-651(-)
MVNKSLLQILGIQRNYKLEQVDKCSQLFVWIEDRTSNGVNEVRRVSADLFEREHSKLEALMEARQWSVEVRQPPPVSPDSGNKATFYGTQLRAPILGSGKKKQHPSREQPKQVIQDELLAAIEDTNKLTSQLEAQLAQLDKEGWSSS